VSKLFEQLQKAAAARARMTGDEVEWARMAAEEAVHKAATAPSREDDAQPEPPSALTRLLASWRARSVAVVAMLALLALGWYFAPWRTPGAEPARAISPSSLKLDPKLNLARPR